MNQRVITLQLERLGHRVDIVGDGKQAVDRLAEAEFDLVFMDCQMPVMDGFTATREIRRRFGDDLRIVAMTASAMPGDREKCFSAGMNDYLSKPVTAAALQRVFSIESEVLAAAPSGGGADAVVVDHERLREVTLGNPTLRDEIIVDYLEQADQTLSELKEAIASADRDLVRRLSHRLAGSSACCGMVALCRPLQMMEAEPGSASVDEWFGQCTAAYERIRCEIEKCYRHLSCAGAAE